MYSSYTILFNNPNININPPPINNYLLLFFILN